jgi:hypothetical protein
MAEEIMAFQMAKGKVHKLRASDMSEMYRRPKKSIYVLADDMEQYDHANARLQAL